MLAITPYRLRLIAFLMAGLFSNPVWTDDVTPTTDHKETQVTDISIVSLRKAAWASYEAEDWPKAIELWSQVLASKPDDNEALRIRGSAYAEHDQHDLALADHRRAVELEPNNANSWSSLCWGRLLANRPLEARPACEKGGGLAPESMVITVNLGHTYLLTGDVATAQTWYEKTVPLLDDENDLKTGPLRDFDIFIQRGWQVETARQAQAWFEEEGRKQLGHKLRAKQLLNRAEASEEAGVVSRALAWHEERLPLLEAQFGSNDDRVIRAVEELGNIALSAKQPNQALMYFQRALAWHEKQENTRAAWMKTYLFYQAAQSLEQLKRLDEAELYYRKAVAGLEQDKGPENIDLAIWLTNLANLLENTGNSVEAEFCYRRGLSIAENSLGPKDPRLERWLKPLAALLTNGGRHAEAEDVRRRLQELPENVDDAFSIRFAANQLIKASRYAEAEPLLRRALAIDEKVHGPEHPDVATGLSNLAGLLETTGRHAEAEPLFRRALAIDENVRGPEHPDVATSLNNLAGLLKTTGRYAEAEPLFRRALAIDEKVHGPEHPDVAANLNNLAVLLTTTGRYTEAETLMRRALAIEEKTLGTEHPTVAGSLSNLASVVLNGTGRYEESEALVIRAWEIRENVLGPDHPEMAKSLIDAANLLHLTGNHTELDPIPLLRRALTLREKFFGQEHPDVAWLLNNLAMQLQTTGRYAEAEPLLLRACRIALNAGEPDLLSHTQDNLSHLYAKLERPDAAIFFGKQAVNTLQGLRQNVAELGKETLKGFDATIEDTYRQLSKLLIAEGRLVEAERVQELLKEQEQFQFVRRDATLAPLAGRAPLTAFEAKQAATLDAAGAPLARLTAERGALEKNKLRSPDEEARLVAVKAELDAANAAFQQVFEQVLAALTAARQDKAEEIKESQGLQNTLRELNKRGENVVALYTVTDKDGYSLVLTTPSHRRAYSVPVKSAELNEQIAAFRAAIMPAPGQPPRQDPRPLAKTLLDLVLPPAAREELDQIQAGKPRVPVTLMWHLDGALRLLPLAALHDGERYLIERYRLVSFTAASLANLKDAPSASWNGLGLGVSQARTVGEKHFNALEAVPAELKTVIRTEDDSGVVPGSRHLDQAFSWETLTAELKDKESYQLVHVASHFNLEPGNDTMSYLLPGAGDPISLAMLNRQDNLFGGVDLLTLSACETAVGGGRSLDGKEVDGLSFIAQRQGAKAVVATLWPVADASTAQLMADFYRLREEKKLTKIEALRQAQLALIRGDNTVVTAQTATDERGAKRANATPEQSVTTYSPDPSAPYAHPYYWAPFILMGNWL